jgi:hypothetical protein
LNALHLVVLALAVARLTRLVTTDTITEKIRNAMLTRWPNSIVVFGDSEVTVEAVDTLGYRVGRLSSGARVFRSGEVWVALEPKTWSTLLSCDWCLSVWVGILMWAGNLV